MKMWTTSYRIERTEYQMEMYFPYWNRPSCFLNSITTINVTSSWANIKWEKHGKHWTRSSQDEKKIWLLYFLKTWKKKGKRKHTHTQVFLKSQDLHLCQMRACQRGKRRVQQENAARVKSATLNTLSVPRQAGNWQKTHFLHTQRRTTTLSNTHTHIKCSEWGAVNTSSLQKKNNSRGKQSRKSQTCFTSACGFVTFSVFFYSAFHFCLSFLFFFACVFNRSAELTSLRACFCSHQPRLLCGSGFLCGTCLLRFLILLLYFYRCIIVKAEKTVVVCS